MEEAVDLVSALKESDLTILLQDHTAYDVDEIARTAQRLLDTRGRASGPRVERL